MVQKKILLILGASGLTGYKALQLGRNTFETVGTFNIRKTTDSSLLHVDISKEESLQKIISEVKPAIVLNTTALHNVDYCETHPDEAFKINKNAVGLMADTCNRIGARLLHISTDFVFGGGKGNYVETDAPNPINVYAKSKLEGEMEAKRCVSHAVIRTSVVYGWTPLETQDSSSSSGKPMNFALWALNKLSKKEELKIVQDQYTSPTLADVLAAACIRVAGSEKNDLYHICGTSRMSRFEFTKKLALMMGHSGDLVRPVASASFEQVARRPTDSSLNCDKIQSYLNYRLLSTDESLAVMRSQIELDSPSLLGN